MHDYLSLSQFEPAADGDSSAVEVDQDLVVPVHTDHLFSQQTQPRWAFKGVGRWAFKRLRVLSYIPYMSGICLI